MMNDHDILIELKQDMHWIKKITGNHLKHHWVITVTALSATLSAITAIVIMLVTRG